MNVAIIGAGVTGLSAAYDLVRAGHSVSLFEAGSEVGGLASGFKAPHWDWTLEKFYHHWFASDAAMLGLIDELGARDRVLFPRPVTVMYHDGRFYQFDSPLSALRFPGLRGFAKIRFGLVGLYLKLTKNWKALEQISVDSWMRQWAGSVAYEALWEPMMIGKFGERYAKEVNMAWFWARIHSRTARLGTFVGGFQAFLDLLADRVRAHGAQIHLNTTVIQIQTANDQVTVQLPNDQLTFDRLLTTTSPALFSQMAPQLPDAYRTQLTALKSLGAVVMVITLDRQLAPVTYWYNLPKGAGFPFLAMVEHTNYMSPEHYGGDHIIYCGDYLETDHRYFDLSKEELLALYLPALKRVNPDFDERWVRNSWLFRTRYAQPVPLLNHSRNIPEVKTPLANVWLASMSQVYPWDRGTNYAVDLGRRTAQAIIATA